MALHPSGILLDIVGIAESDRGRSCEIHKKCGSLLKPDVLVRIRAVRIVNDRGEEEPAMAVYWVTDGVDRCRVGFLPRYLIKHKADYDGKLAQVVEMLSSSSSPSDRKKNHRNKGVCQAVIVEAESASNKRQKLDHNNTDEGVDESFVDCNEEN